MRHHVVRKRLNRDMDHRKSLLLNLSKELIKNERIETTLVKAKYLRPYIEKLITKAKEAVETADKVLAFNQVKILRSELRTEDAVRKLVSEIAPRYKGINGGYTKIVRTRYRDGDKALMGRIELTKKAELKKAPVKKSLEKKPGDKSETKKEAVNVSEKPAKKSSETKVK